MKPSWKYCFNEYLPDRQCTVYRDERLGVQLQVVSFERPGIFGTRDRTYRFYIDGIDKSFSTEESMLRTLQKTRFVRTHPLR